MLTSMRALSKTWVVKGLMALLVVSFAVWGIGDMFRNNPALREVASVGKESITVQDLEFRFQRSLPEARRQFGADLTAAEARKMGVLDQTLNLMIDESSFNQEAERLGITAGRDIILENLAAIPQFRDKEGAFNASLFQQILRKNGISEQYFLETEQKDIARRILLKAVASSTSVPKTIIDNIYQARGSKRILEIVSLRNDSMKDIPEPDEEALKAFYQEHETTFLAPEYRGITIARLSADDTVKDVIITHEEVRAYYDANTSAYTLPQRRDLIQVVLQDEEKAAALSKKAISIKNLSAAAKSIGLTPIIMKKIDDKTILPALYTTVFGLDKGDISPPVKSNLGWHVLQLSEIYAGGQQSFEEVKETIRTTLQQERVGDLLARNVNKLDDTIAEGTPLEEMADSLKLRLTRYPALTAKGIGEDEKKILDIPVQETVLKAAFSQESGETSQVIEDDKGNYLVVRTDLIKPTHTRAFNDVKEKVSEAWYDQALAEKASKEANRIAEEMRQGKKATSYASLPGVNIRLSSPISLLGDMDKDLIPTAVKHVFVMKKNDVVALSGPGKQYIIKLADIVPVDPQKPEPSRLKVVDELKKVLPLEFVAQYSEYVKKLFPVNIDSKLLEDLRKRGIDPNS